VILDELNKVAGEFNKIFALLSDAQIGASNRNVGSAAFKARFGMQEDAVRDITKAVELLDPTFVKTEKDAAKLFAQLDRISKVMKLVQGPDSAKVLEDRGLLGPLVEASNQMDDIRDKVNATLKAQKELTKATKETTEPTKVITEKTKETVTAIESQVTVSELFNKSLGETSFFVNNLSLGSNKFADALINVKSEADRLKETFMEIGQGIEQGIVSNLTDAVMGTQTLAQAAVNVLNQLKRKLVEVAIQRAVSGIGNRVGGFLGGLFGGRGGGGLFSGGGGSGVKFGSVNLGLSSGLGFANGGRPPVGRASLVGERGPEMFVPSTAGTIIPNNKLGGGTTNIVNVSVDASGSAVSGNNQDAQALGNVIGAAIRAELIKEKRAGGLLSK